MNKAKIKMNATITPTYVEHEFSLGFVWSILQSFILTLFAEIGDKTFIMLMILTYSTTTSTIVYSAIIVELSMNIIAMIIGLAIDVLLYKNLIDYLGLIIFIIYYLYSKINYLK